VNWLWFLPAVAIVMLFGALGGYFFKLSSKTISIHPMRLLRNWRFWAGGFLYAISLIGYFMLLRLVPLSVMYPLSSITYIWVALLSWWLLKERFTGKKIAGIALIVVGIVVLAVGYS